MSDQPRNWDKELAEIDKVIARMPAQPPPAQAPARVPPGTPPAGPPGAARAQPVLTSGGATPIRRRDRAATWVWIALALALGVLMPLWPQARDCGLGLIYYLAAGAALVITALLGARAAWRRRQGLAHTMALLLLAWGGVLVAREVLPRVGYAADAATWRCPAAPPPASQAVPGAP